MKVLILFVGWCILFVLSWPVALLALVLFPVVWLVSLPLRLIGITGRSDLRAGSGFIVSPRPPARAETRQVSRLMTVGVRPSPGAATSANSRS